MRRIEIVLHPTAAELERQVAFVEELTGLLGGRPLSDHLWLDLLAGGATGFVSVVVVRPSGDAQQVLALAQVSAANDGRVLEAVVRPGTDVPVLLRDVVDTAVDAIARDGGGRLTWWVDNTDDTVRSIAADHGLEPTRALHEMRRPLPYPARASVVTRAYVPGADDDAWIAVNNRAFAGHGEQGGWTRDTLELRMREPWFDPSGFRVLELDGDLVAFCWTKVHRDRKPPAGEIYVIAVDPSAHGRGLGRELTLAGLDSLIDRGITEAFLFVDAGNAAAVHLYEGLGFTVHRTRRAFSGTLEGS